MPTLRRSVGGRKCSQSASFTLIELLTVIAIIAILASLVLYAGNALMTKAKRSRSATEVQALTTALEGYKTDNGIYPASDGTLLTNTYAASDGTTGAYQTNGTVLFTTLSGQNYVAQSGVNAGAKSYMSFKANQVGNPTGPFSYVKDPWGNSYGYNTTTGTATSPYNGAGFFDVWSTGGVTKAQVAATPTLTNAWISNWQ